MKKIFMSLLMLMAMAVSANAEMKTVWEGSHEIGNWNWDERLEIAADVFSTLADGDKVVITMVPNVEDAGTETWYQYDITANDYVENRDPQRTPIANGNISDAGDITISLTNEQADLLRNSGMIINGHYVIVTKIAIGNDDGGETQPSIDGVSTELWSGTTVTGNWAEAVLLSYDNKPTAITTAKVGDVIVVTYDAEGEDAHVQIANPDGWVAFDENSETDAPAQGTGQIFTYTIDDVPTLELIQMNGIIVRGKNITITKVELVTDDDHYDAVAITIGEAGIATYSNSSKCLDFNGAAIKAYYATAVETGKVTLTPTSTVPAYTGIIVKGEPGIYVVRTGEAEAVETNYLRAVGDWNQNIQPSVDGGYLYTLTESGEPTFSLVAAGTEVEARKAYLETATDITPATGNIELVFSDDPSTGITDVTIGEKGDDAYYNLQGVRVVYPSKGIYIHNGKKVIIK